MAAEKAQSPAEKKIVDGYRQVLEVYKDSGKIWDVEIETPSLRHSAEEYIRTIGVVGGDYSAIGKNQDFRLATMRGIPLDVYPSGRTGLDAIVNRYSIPVEKQEEYRIISKSSIQLLWQKAEEEMEEVNKLRN